MTTCAQIDLQALQDNFDQVRKLAPRSKIMAVIKANGYGHGMLRVARALSGADGFAVARLEEGLTLRRHGILQRVVVLQGFRDRDQLRQCVDYRLEPVIHSPLQVHLIEAAEPAPSLRVVLKLDSGMHRLGLDPQTFTRMLSRLQARLGAEAMTLMTHLACADEPGNEGAQGQILLFDRLTRSLSHAKSIANSAAILAWPQTHADWVRPGLMLYGVSPFPDQRGEELGLRPVMTFSSRVIAINQIEAGQAVGYGGTWVSSRPTRLGVVAAGYGDGYPREVPSGTPVLVAGVRVPLVGRVSMDMLSVDLTDYPAIQVGAEVTLWGDRLPVEEIAHYAGTIPYTLLCGVTARVPMIEVAGQRETGHGARQGCL